MFGNNKKKSLLSGDGSILQVHKIFKTFQGEGPFTGNPSIFIRLSGCNLACKFCDTEFETFEEMGINKIIEHLNNLSGLKNKFTHKLVVITGGEPFRQPIEMLCEKLINLGYKVQIETNGTIYRDIDDNIKIICSPKNNGRGYQKIRDDLLERIDALKFIISHRFSDYNFVEDVGQNKYNIPVYVQPMDEYDDEINIKNLEYTKKLANENGYLLSLQTHKFGKFE